MENNELLLLKDIIQILMEKAKDSREKSGQDQLEMGQSLAYYDMLSLIRQQAIAFDLSLQSLGLENYNPDIEAL